MCDDDDNVRFRAIVSVVELTVTVEYDHIS